MKKVLISALFISLIWGLTASAQPDEIKFRGHEWGESQESVIETETKGMTEGVDFAVMDDNSLLIANGSVSIFDCSISFDFNEDNQLYSGIYVLTEKHANDYTYYEDFNTLEKALISVYGEPQISQDRWKDDLYKDDPDEIGIAIAAEHLVLYREWDAKDGSSCILSCYGNNFQISNVLFYDAPTTSDLKPEDNSKTNGL